MTSLSPAAPWVAVGLVVLTALLILRRPLIWLLRLLLRSGAALAGLAFLQQAGGLFGVTLGVNWLNALILGALGLPGFGLLLMLRWLLRT